MFTLNGSTILEDGSPVATVINGPPHDDGPRLVGLLNGYTIDEDLFDAIGSLIAERHEAKS